jgi:hypothetical protein
MTSIKPSRSRGARLHCRASRLDTTTETRARVLDLDERLGRAAAAAFTRDDDRQLSWAAAVVGLAIEPTWRACVTLSSAIGLRRKRCAHGGD